MPHWHTGAAAIREKDKLHTNRCYGIVIPEKQHAGPGVGCITITTIPELLLLLLLLTALLLL